MPCSGLRISNNFFLDNHGCYKYAGSLISIQCEYELETVIQYQETINYDTDWGFELSTD